MAYRLTRDRRIFVYSAVLAPDGAFPETVRVWGQANVSVLGGTPGMASPVDTKSRTIKSRRVS
jgi:hypothetical protein